MNEQSIQSDYEHIVYLLQTKRLKEAQQQLDTLLQTSDDWQLRNRLEQVRLSYGYMLSYMKRGMVDPERQKMHALLLTETWEIADQARITMLDKYSNRHYHAMRRMQGVQLRSYQLNTLLKKLEAFPDEVAVYQLMPEVQGMQQLLEHHNETLRNLFDATWCNSCWNGDELEQAKAYLNSELLPVNALCLFVSAITLSLIECFDARKFLWLQTATTHSQVMVNQRAFVGIAIVLLTQPLCLHRYPELVRNFDLFNGSGHFAKLLNRIYLELLRAKETEKVDKKMREEILPEMIKNVKKMRGMNFGMEEGTDEDDRNPDWGKAFEESGLNDKIREMGELQMEGADIYMSTFSQLKHYPFFKSMHNWFYPFDRMHPEVAKVLGTEKEEKSVLVTLILNSGFFCNSDKYSMTFMMAQLPETQRNVMLSQLSAQGIDDVADESKFAGMKEYAERPQVISSQYIQDLYRFLKLNGRRTEFPDIFKQEIALHHIPGMEDLLGAPELLLQIADFLFHKEHYSEALDMYREATTKLEHIDAELFQKTGYCLQKEKRYREAVEAYHHADALKPDYVWTIRHLATCYRLMKEYEPALAYYQHAEAIQPENRNILLQAGSCLVQLERYDEALQYFFKLHFLDDNNAKALRAIGWSSFLSGKYEQAMKYYDQLMEKNTKPTADDYFNAGHVAWKQGDALRAIAFYSKAARLCEDRTAFVEMFLQDEELLRQHGFEETDIRLIIDMV